VGEKAVFGVIGPGLPGTRDRLAAALEGMVHASPAL
jgi:hypothetical protein